MPPVCAACAPAARTRDAAAFGLPGALPWGRIAPLAEVAAVSRCSPGELIDFSMMRSIRDVSTCACMASERALSNRCTVSHIGTETVAADMPPYCIAASSPAGIVANSAPDVDTGATGAQKEELSSGKASILKSPPSSP
ncbi:MAG: hypothetical protein IIT98_04810 [Kiritimatiellae bacterium]|nr:hypothetical protein [Kiritimatiellia bacterium]